MFTILFAYIALLILVVQSKFQETCHVFAFYYLWYGIPEIDGEYKHWNHKVLPHWNSNIQKKYHHLENYSYSPPEELHSPFYPLRGVYSVMSSDTISAHLDEITAAGIDTLVLSWWGRPELETSADTQGINTDEALQNFVSITEKQSRVKIAIHLEPYAGRTIQSIREDIIYIHKTYGESEAMLKIENRMVFFVYDSYHIPSEQWSKLLQTGKEHSLDRKKYPSIFIGLWLNFRDGDELYKSGFNGAYSYFASNGFSYGSTVSNWPKMARFLAARDMIFIPCVSPGYNDSKIRPWNTENIKNREQGRYYDNMWKAALDAGATFLAITTFNEWGEGTQIEPAACRTGFVEYPNGEPEYYLHKTYEWRRKLCMRYKHDEI